MMKILIIEDDKPLVEVLGGELRKAGFETETAFDGRQALEILKTLKPDLILLDIILPEINGFEVLASIKQNLSLREIPIIVLSNLGQDEDVKKALSLGADDYYVKAQHPLSEIIGQIKKILF